MNHGRTVGSAGGFEVRVAVAQSGVVVRVAKKDANEDVPGGPLEARALAALIFVAADEADRVRRGGGGPFEMHVPAR